MALEDIAEKAGQNIITYLAVSLLGGGVFLVRRIFTNQALIKENQAANDRRLTELQTEIRTREEIRQLDRGHILERMDDMKATIQETRNDVRKISER